MLSHRRAAGTGSSHRHHDDDAGTPPCRTRKAFFTPGHCTARSAFREFFRDRDDPCGELHLGSPYSLRVARSDTRLQLADSRCGVVKLVDAKPVSGSDNSAVESGGYQQELKRSLGSFQVFAISFAFISVAVGIFGTYDDVLQNSGPIGIWLWIIVAAGQLLVALVVAQFAARISLSGSSYQWASRLANPKIGWGFAG